MKKVREEIKKGEYYVPLSEEHQKKIDFILKKTDYLLAEYKSIYEETSKETPFLSSDEIFEECMISPYSNARVNLSSYNIRKNAASDKDEFNESREAIDDKLIADLSEGLVRVKGYIKLYKSHVGNDKLSKYLRSKENDIKELNILTINIQKKKFKINFIRYIIFFAIFLLLTPFIFLLWNHNYEVIVDISQNSLRLVIPGTLGMLGLVVTSATFLVNFYKDSLKMEEFLENRIVFDEQIVKTKNPDKLLILANEFMKENKNTIFNVVMARNISKNLNKLLIYLVSFLIISLFSFMLLSMPFEFNKWLSSFLLICLAILFINVIFTILFIIRIITSKLLFPDVISTFEHNQE